MHLRTDIKNLKKLLDEKKWGQAQRLIQGYLDTELSVDEKAIVYLALIEAYVSLMKQTGEEYLSALDDVLKDLEKVKIEEKDILAKIKLEKVKSEIREL